jgi:uncharacterized membrane protein
MVEGGIEVMVGLTMYTTLKFLHVLLAIVAVGFNASYGIWLAAAARNPEYERFVLRRIKVLDDRFANPAYGLLLVTGLLMVWVGDLRLATFWLAAALVLFGVLLVLGLGVYTPTLRRQITALEEHGPASPEYRALARRGTLVGAVLGVVVVVIVFLMVTKPTF